MNSRIWLNKKNVKSVCLFGSYPLSPVSHMHKLLHYKAFWTPVSHILYAIFCIHGVLSPCITYIYAQTSVYKAFCASVSHINKLLCYRAFWVPVSHIHKLLCHKTNTCEAPYSYWLPLTNPCMGFTGINDIIMTSEMPQSDSCDCCNNPHLTDLWAMTLILNFPAGVSALYFYLTVWFHLNIHFCCC